MTTDAVPLPATMRAWTQHRYGGPDVVAFEESALPVPGAGEVLLRVRATALNSADVRIMRGDPALIRLAFGLRRPRVAVQGRDVAGTVVARGPGVTALGIGDEVMGEITGGGLAPYVSARASALVRRPPELDPIVAATLPLAGGTAWQALELGVGAGAGDVVGARVLVLGAGGGVGTFAVRLAALRGAQVTALAGERALPVLRQLGAAVAVDYRGTGVRDLAEASFDAVLAVAGAYRLRDLRRLVVRGGTVVLVTGGTNRITGPIAQILGSMVMSIGSPRRIRPLAAAAKPDVTTELIRLAAAGALAPHIERTWPLAEAGAALAHIDAGHTIGKVVVTAD
jgi:NADPH:quinone reductase-like Zn-dependent oxidoreductase